jgi:hypothetical protein
LAGSEITSNNTNGNTAIFGNLGITGTLVTGFAFNASGTAIVSGPNEDIANGNATLGQTNLTTAINAAKSPTPQQIPSELGGQTLLAGVYNNSTSGTFTISSGTLTLDAQGNSAAVWIFQMASTLTTTGGSVVMANSGNPCNVFWQVGSSATLGDPNFEGNILATTSIFLTNPTGVTMCGRLLATTAVTLSSDDITGCTCPNNTCP